MKAAGNGTPEQCTANLFSLTRGEVPYDRLRGVDPTLIDRPASASTRSKVVADLQWLYKTYEPRVQISAIQLEAYAAEHGLFDLNIDGITP